MTSTWNSGSTFPISSYGDEGNGKDLKNENGFTFIDFLPDCRDPGGFFSAPVYESFRPLIDRANDWLRANNSWQITTCESVEFKAKSGQVDYNKMTYVELGESMTRYIRGLRLWLTKRKNMAEREQQIGYVNLIPEKLEESGIFRSAKFETLDDVIRRFNSTLLINPLPGRIITIECQEMKLSSFFEKLEPDRTTWTERGDVNKHFLFIIRIFYEVMSGNHEEIGIKDFIPDKLKDGGLFSLAEYEPFSDTVKKASDWCTKQNDLRFCNAQSLEVKKRGGKPLNTEKMDYFEHGNVGTTYVRILRVTYTKPLAHDYTVDKPFPVRQLTCKTFVPVQLTTSIFLPEYENLLQTKQRVISWIKATEADVISAETTALRMMSGEMGRDAERSITHNRAERHDYFIFIIRVYLNGVYREPPAEMLPPVPELDTKNCCTTS